MTQLTLYAAGQLADTTDPRVKRGLLLPFGQPGHTNLGRVTASADSQLVLGEHPGLTYEHVATLPVADIIDTTTAAEGIWCSIRYLDTPLGDAALAELEAGDRTGLSVEVDQPIIGNGHLLGGILTGGSQVLTPAFTAARLAASELGPAPDTTPPPSPPIQRQPPVDTQPPTMEGTAMPNTTVPTAPPAAPPATPVVVQAPALIAAGQPTPPVDQATLFATLAALAPAAAGGRDPHQLRAALADIIPGDILGQELPQHVGELWDGKAYERRIVPLYNHADLTSFTVDGWRWVARPEVDDYAGNKTPVPSAEVETEAVSIEAYRLAGAHNIDRKFRDFGNTAFWEAYYRAMTESVAKKSDHRVRDEVRDAATRVHLLTGTAPAGVPTCLWQIVKGVSHILSTLEVLPDHALVTMDYWEPLMYTKATDVLVYLDAMLGFKEGTLQKNSFRIVPVPVGSLTVPDGDDPGTDPDWVGKTLVGCRDAVTVHELGGGAPIRVEAPNVGLGGIDSGVFYYGAVNIHSADGLVLFDTPAAS